MSARIARTASILIATSFLVAGPALAGPWVLAPKEWYSTIESGVSSSPNTFLDSGTSTRVGLVIEQRQVALTNEYGWKKRMNLLFRLPLVSITRQNDFNGAHATATGFQDLMAGIRFRVLERRLPSTIELSWTGPLGYNRYLDTLGMSLGDGLQQLELEAHLGLPLMKRGFVQVSAGRAIRFLGQKSLVAGLRNTKPKDPSELTGHGSEKFHYQDRLTGSADVAMWVTQSVLVAGSYRGFVGLANGPLAEDVNLHLFGPQLLYRLDDRLDLYGGTWTSTAGKNTQSFTQVYAGLAFHKTKLNRLQGFLGSKQAP